MTEIAQPQAPTHAPKSEARPASRDELKSMKVRPVKEVAKEVGFDATKAIVSKIRSFLDGAKQTKNVLKDPRGLLLGHERPQYDSGRTMSPRARAAENARMSSTDNNPFVSNYSDMSIEEKRERYSPEKHAQLKAQYKAEETLANPQAAREVIEDIAHQTNDEAPENSQPEATILNIAGSEYAVHPDDFEGDGPVRYATGHEDGTIIRGQWNRDQFNALRDASATIASLSIPEETVQDSIGTEGDTPQADENSRRNAESTAMTDVRDSASDEGTTANSEGTQKTQQEIIKSHLTDTIAEIDLVLAKIQGANKQLLGVADGVNFTEDEKTALYDKLHNVETLLKIEALKDPVFANMIKTLNANTSLVSFSTGWHFQPNPDVTEVTRHTREDGSVVFDVPPESYELFVAGRLLTGTYSTLAAPETQLRGTSATSTYTRPLTGLRDYLKRKYLSK